MTDDAAAKAARNIVCFDIPWTSGVSEKNSAQLQEAIAQAIRDAVAPYQREQNEIDQILGKALGYPEADETIMEKPDGSVVTGDHTPVTLAMEAARKLRDAVADERERVAKLVEDEINRAWIDGSELHGMVYNVFPAIKRIAGAEPAAKEDGDAKDS